VTRGIGPKLGNNPTPLAESDVNTFQQNGLPTDRLWSIVGHFEQ
jgi:hypothetical protein